MRKPAILASILLASALASCEPPPEVGMALSEPDPALLDTRIAGIWYSIGNDDYTLRDPSFLEIVPRTDGGGMDVIGIRMSRSGKKSVQWLRATAYASEIDGEIYYNVKRVAWVGDDYTGENSNSFIILKPEIAPDASFLFLRSLDPPLLKKMAEEGRVRKRDISTLGAGPGTSYKIYDFSRDDLIRLIRETPRAELFAMITGPFYRMGPDFRTVTAASGSGPSAAIAKFGTWIVGCRGPDDAGHGRSCSVRDESENVVISTPGGVTLIGKERCDTSGALARVDDSAPMELTVEDRSVPWFEPRIDRLPRILSYSANAEIVARMHFGRILHLEFRDCASDDPRRAEVDLDNFAAALSTAKSLVYLTGGD